MGRVFDEQCPHCGEELEILAPKQGMKSFMYTCPYCKYKFDIMRDEEDIVRLTSRTEKILRYILWGIIIIFILWAIWATYFVNSTPTSKLRFDVNIAAEVFVNGEYVGRMSNREISYNLVDCSVKHIRIVYEDFSYEKQINPCLTISFDKEYANYIINVKKDK